MSLLAEMQNTLKLNFHSLLHLSFFQGKLVALVSMFQDLNLRVRLSTYAAWWRTRAEVLKVRTRPQSGLRAVAVRRQAESKPEPEMFISHRVTPLRSFLFPSLIRKFYLTRNPIHVTFNVRTIFSNYERHAIARVCVPSRRLNPYVGNLLRSFWHKTTLNFHFLDIFVSYISTIKSCREILSIRTLDIFIRLSGDENIYREA